MSFLLPFWLVFLLYLDNIYLQLSLSVFAVTSLFLKGVVDFFFKPKLSWFCVRHHNCYSATNVSEPKSATVSLRDVFSPQTPPFFTQMVASHWNDLWNLQTSPLLLVWSRTVMSLHTDRRWIGLSRGRHISNRLFGFFFGRMRKSPVSFPIYFQ